MDIFKETNNGGLEIALDNMSKASLKSIASNVLENVFSGNADALEEYIKAKGIAELASFITDGLKSEAIKEASRYSAEDKVLGCSIQVKSSPYQYDFSHDEEWDLLNRQIQMLRNEQKEREKKMIDAMRYTELVDENGEVIPPAIIKSGGGETIAVTIPK